MAPNGQFGTRAQGGSDAASPRYIFTQLTPIARKMFRAADDPLLQYLDEDGKKIEPEWYMPVIPMILVNGADGIGTGNTLLMFSNFKGGVVKYLTSTLKISSKTSVALSKARKPNQ